MKLGRLRELTQNLPDNAEVVFWEDENATWYEANINQVVPATPIHPNPVLVLDLGQQVEMEFDLAVRTGIDEDA